MTITNEKQLQLKLLWNQLDNACGELDNALFNISMVSDMPKEIKESADSIDFISIVMLKNQVEELMEAEDAKVKAKKESL